MCGVCVHVCDAHVCMCVYMCVWLCVFVCEYICMCVRVYTCMRMCGYVYVCAARVKICTYKCICFANMCMHMDIVKQLIVIVFISYQSLHQTRHTF